MMHIVIEMKKKKQAILDAMLICLVYSPFFFVGFGIYYYLLLKHE